MTDPRPVAGTGLLDWIDARFPVRALVRSHLTAYYVPKNFNVWYLFGSLALLVLVIQLVSGVFLAMHYKPDIERAFDSIQFIMREVPWGWLIRYAHTTGASLLFVVLYLHIVRGMLYGSYRRPRELVWMLGVLLLLCLMAEAFFGYLLPWGQMSYWGAQAIINLFAAIPWVGPELAVWIRGDYVVSDATLNRFFALHVIAIPLVVALLVVAHIAALHAVGPNNPDGVEMTTLRDARGQPLDGLPLHPYYTARDLLGVAVFLLVFAAIVFFAPEMGGFFIEYNNAVPADAMRTPSHLAPVWYFTPFYAMLRAMTEQFTWVLASLALVGAVVRVGITRRRGRVRWPLPVVLGLLAVLLVRSDAAFWGVVVLGGAVGILFFLPWLDQSPVRSIRYRPRWQQALYGLFFITFVGLGVLGMQTPSALVTRLAQVGTLIYFGFFLLMPWWSGVGQFRPEPARLTLPRRRQRREARG